MSQSADDLQQADSAGGKQGRRRWIALAVMLAAMAMDLLDVAIVNLALPAIRAETGASPAALTWIVASYPLTFGVFLVLGGRLGDRFGRKRMFMLGVLGFTLASVLCGLAPSAGPLIVGRVLQGVFAAIMTPQILSVIQINFTPAERPKAYAAFGAVQGVATVGGPVLGGVLIDADLFGLAWRPIFLINVPIGLVTIIAAAVLLAESRAEGARQFDITGVALLGLPLFLLLFPLIHGAEAGWGPTSALMLLAVAPLFALFLWHQHRRDRAGHAALVPPRLFRQRGFTGGVLTGMVFFAGVVGFLMVFALTMQVGLGFTARSVGMMLIPYSIGIAAASGMAFPLVPRLGRSLIALGAVVKGSGMAILLATFLAVDAITWWHPLPGLLVCGIGMGLVAPTIADVALARVQSSDAGAASGGLITSGQIGGATGVALISSVFFGVLALSTAGVTEAGPGEFTHAFLWALAFEILVMAVAAVLTLVLPRTASADTSSDTAH